MDDPTVDYLMKDEWQMMYTRARDLRMLSVEKYLKPITQEEVDDYEAVTFFEGCEVYEAFDLYAFLTRNTEYVPQTGVYMTINKMFRRMPSFWICPWKDRLIKLFCPDGKIMRFVDWLGLHNAFHRHTPLEYKMEVAFRIFDFDDDGFISIHDVIKYLQRCSGDPLHLDYYDYRAVAKMIVEYYDFDNDGFIGLTDFKLGMQNDEDFEDKFFQDIWLKRDMRQFLTYDQYDGEVFSIDFRTLLPPY